MDLNYLESSIQSEKTKNFNEEAVSLLREDEEESIYIYIQECSICSCGFGVHYILYYFFLVLPKEIIFFTSCRPFLKGRLWPGINGNKEIHGPWTYSPD